MAGGKQISTMGHGRFDLLLEPPIAQAPYIFQQSSIQHTVVTGYHWRRALTVIARRILSGVLP